MDSANAQARPYLVGALITSMVGAIMLLVADFAGWEYSVAYGDQNLYRGGSIGLISSYFIVIAVFAGLLLYAAYVCYQCLKPDETGLLQSRLQRGFYAAGLAALACLVAGILFALVIAFEEVEDWWLDLGFYGGLIGGALTATFFRLALRSGAR